MGNIQLYFNSAIAGPKFHRSQHRNSHTTHPNGVLCHAHHLVLTQQAPPTQFRDCASILDSIAKGISLFPRFFAGCIPTSILNDFYTCSTYFSGFAYKRSYAHAYMRSARRAAPLSHVSLVKWRRSSSHTLSS